MSKLKFILCFAFLFLFSCSGERKSSTDPWGLDCTPPAAISDLSATPGTEPGTIDLSWTASGDDALFGCAYRYRVKYSISPITESNFNLVPTYSQTWLPLSSGQSENKILTDLFGGTSYYFAIKVQDEVSNTSELSNVPLAEVTSGLQALGWLGGGYSGWQNGAAPLVGGTDSYSFDWPSGLFITPSGELYIADQYNHRICKWSASGQFIGWLGGGIDEWQFGSAPSSGTDYQSFYRPCAVALDSAENIYVVDTWNHRICKWNSSRIAQGWIGGGVDGWQMGSASLVIGNDYQSFSGPCGIFIDSSDVLYIADTGNNRISKWSSSGVALGWIGGGVDGWQTGIGSSNGSTYNRFSGPMGISVASTGDLFIADTSNNRISKWSSVGVAQGWIGGGVNGWQFGTAPLSGVDYQSFGIPRQVFVTSSGDLYVTDFHNHRVSKWSSAGVAQGWFGGGVGDWQFGSAPIEASDWQSFWYPYGIFVLDTTIYIGDRNNHRISKWHE